MMPDSLPILLVEDNPEQAQLFSLILSQDGYQVIASAMPGRRWRAWRNPRWRCCSRIGACRAPKVMR